MLGEILTMILIIIIIIILLLAIIGEILLIAWMVKEDIKKERLRRKWKL